MLVELLSIHGEASSLGNVQVEDNVTPKSARLRKTVDFQQLIWEQTVSMWRMGVVQGFLLLSWKKCVVHFFVGGSQDP